jgi:transposase
VDDLFGGLDNEGRSHVALQDWMVFSLDVHTAREDEWDRDEILRGFSGCRDFGLSLWKRPRVVTIRIERRGVRRYACNACGRRSGRVRSSRDRTWDDLPWATRHVTLTYSQRRVVCRHRGIRTERIEFADAKARVTRRLRQQIGVDCQSMPTSHAAVRHGVSWGKARRAEKAFLAGWIARA